MKKNIDKHCNLNNTSTRLGIKYLCVYFFVCFRQKAKLKKSNTPPWPICLISIDQYKDLRSCLII